MQDDDLTIPLVEESLTVGTEDRVTGRVRVNVHTEQVTEMASAELAETDVVVKRVQIDREVSSIPDIRTEGDTTIVPVMEEILVVEKRLVLKEELHVTRRVTNRTMETPVVLQKQTATVDRIEPDPET